jgi:hypothetical protein
MSQATVDPDLARQGKVTKLDGPARQDRVGRDWPTIGHTGPLHLL